MNEGNDYLEGTVLDSVQQGGYFLTSPETKELYEALAKAQAKLRNLERSRQVDVTKNGAFLYSYRYTPLDDVLEHARPILSAEGIAILQGVVAAPGKIGVSTRLTHSSGQWIETLPLLLPCGSTAQEYGSALSYSRRYSLAPILGIASDEDNDAQGADLRRQTGGSGSAEKQTHGTRSSGSGSGGSAERGGDATQNQLGAISAELGKLHATEAESRELLAFVTGKRSRHELTKAEASKMLDFLKKETAIALQRLEEIRIALASAPEGA